ncbi:AraC family transcriptional regulator [Vibrio parahaemolyticus]|uniref:AraC family transcriptional regulator n=1 Tax=Vibrio parahaemolyticus TaxID=670 RepID=UPI00215BE71C|nr:AraC family transcriptional regulator [Vibrio parahaemolyticus]EGQ8533383.1 helix-turn-helix domain-containing protein [Vibrio parahaemolyticus]EJB8505122.1 AraC family transcriptional regulator [Vibrio parahaemolyticus]EJL3960517.1 AraC family transcriptional regulator [Vibrio parahaemolyticus]MCR9867986.1 AraC family transcriptional regulator [Vibrio parahaemolyticus]
MTKAQHNAQVQRVCDYIHHHLDDTFTLDVLSTVAGSSKFHFHRVFLSVVGVSALQYVQLARMKRASFRLAFEPTQTITDIAFEAQFDSLEAFSRAFSRCFAQTPSQFRRAPDWPNWHARYDMTPPKQRELTMNVSIIDFKARDVALIEHCGSPRLVLETAANFVQWRKTTGLSPVKTSETFGVPYSDPDQTPEAAFRFDICGTHQGEVPENVFGVKAGVIPGGRCAVAIHKGSHDTIGETVYYLYRNWLPESNENVRDYPCFFQYLNFVHEVDECELLTKVYLPIE